MRNCMIVAVTVLIVCIGHATALGYDYSDYTWFTYTGPGHNNGHQYALTLGDGASWWEAESQASAMGGHLVTINDQVEQDWLVTKFPPGQSADPASAPWIGLWQDESDPGYSEPAGGWKWISAECVTYTNWYGSEPNEAPPPDTNEDGAQMNAFVPGGWQDVPRDASYAYRLGIIEIEPAASAQYEYCDYTWFTYTGPGHNNGHQYALTLGDGASWWEAEAQAVAMGGHLVTINDQAEQDWLITEFPVGQSADPASVPWIGLWQDESDPGYSEPAGGWKWISGECVTYTNWYGSEPNEAPPPDTNEDGAQMNAFVPGGWQDVPRDASYAYRLGIIEIIPEPTTVSLLDIKPSSCPNPVNIKSQGKLPVALMGTPDFDVTMIDYASLALSRADGVGGTVAPLEGPPGPHTTIDDVATPFQGEACDCHEMEGDGIDDLAMKFSTPEVVEALALDTLAPGEMVELILSGILVDGSLFTVSDCVLTVPQSDFDADNDVDLRDFGLFQRCFGGPGQEIWDGCEIVDIDEDGDVDISDFGRFQRCMSGPNHAVDPACDD